MLGQYSRKKAEHDDPTDHIRPVEEGRGNDAASHAAGGARGTGKLNKASRSGLFVV